MNALTPPETDQLPDATTAPFEFALLTLSLIDEEAFNTDDSTDIDAALLEGGFSLKYSLGQALEFSLSYNKDQQQFNAAVRSAEPLEQASKAFLALQLNHLMPVERRFAIDASTKCLVLQESWPSEGLEMTELAEGLRNLIEAMDALRATTMSLSAADNPSDPQSMVRV